VSGQFVRLAGRSAVLARILWLASCAAILLLAGGVYLPAMTGGFIWDDLEILSGSAIGGGESLADCFTRPFLENYYRPFVSASFYLERTLAGRTPFFYHQTNVLIHVLTTLVIILAARDLFRRPAAALLAGALFAVQPAQVSAVAWIGGRTDSLSALFLAVFAWLLLRGVQLEGAVRAGSLAGGALALFGALMTKEQALPAVLLAPLAGWLWTPGSRRERLAAAVRVGLPYAAMAALFVVLHLRFGPPPPPALDEPAAFVAQQAGRTVAHYAHLLAAPTPRVLHTMTLGAYVRAGWGWTMAGAAVAVGAFCLFLHWRRAQPAAAWWLAFIGANLLLVSNLYPVPSMAVTPYRAGAAGVGAAVLGGWLIVAGWEALRRARRGRILRPMWAAGVGAFLVWCTCLSAWGTAQWTSEEQAARAFARHDPDSVWAGYNLSTSLLNRRRFAEGAVVMEQLLDRLFDGPGWRDPAAAEHIARTSPRLLRRIHEAQGTRANPLLFLAAALSRLGFARLECRDFAGAAEAFRSALRMDRAHAEAHAGLEETRLRQKRPRPAAQHLRLAVALDPGNARALARLGDACAQLREWTQAADAYRLAIRRTPWAASLYMDLARVQVHLGDRAAARATLEEAVRRAPAQDDLWRMIASLPQTGLAP